MYEDTYPNLRPTLADLGEIDHPQVLYRRRFYANDEQDWIKVSSFFKEDVDEAIANKLPIIRRMVADAKESNK